MTEYEILSFIHKHNNEVSLNDLAIESISGRNPDILTDKQRVSYLIEEGYISGSALDDSLLSVTAKGIFRLDSLTQEHREKTKQRRHEWSLAAFSAVVGAFLSEPLWGLLEKLLP